MNETSVLLRRPPLSDETDVHIVCVCEPNIAVCGTYRPGPFKDDDSEVTCVVCAAMEYVPCPRCGDE
jgi:hypothetical protein